MIETLAPGPAARRPVLPVRARPVADVRRDAADQHRAGRLHRARRVRGDRGLRRWSAIAAARASRSLLLLPVAFGFGYALQRYVLNGTLGRDPLPSLVVTFGLSIVIQNLLLEAVLGRPALDRHRRASTREPRAAGGAGGRRAAAGRSSRVALAAHRGAAVAVRPHGARPRVPRRVRRPRDRRADGAGRAARSMRWPPPSPSC